MDLGSAAVTIGANIAPFQAALKKVRVELAAIASPVSSIGFSGLVEVMGKLAASIKMVAGAMVMINIGVGISLGGSLAYAAKKASDLQEAVNKAKIAFGSGWPTVNAEIEKMVSLFGESRREMTDLVSQLGIMYGGVGLNTRAVADMSSAMTDFAIDVASLQNLSVAEVLAKIQSGLAGETRALRTIGIAINENLVEMAAYSLGIARMGEELSEVQKVVARHYLILQKGAVNVGDAGRTHMQFAGQLRELRGRFMNLVDTIGAVVMPIFTDLLQIGIRVFKGLGDWWSDHEKTIQAFVDKFRGMIAEIIWVYDNWGRIMEGVKARAETYWNVMKLYVEHYWNTIKAFGTWLAAEWPNLLVDAFNLAVTVVKNAFANMTTLAIAFGRWLGSEWINLIRDAFNLLTTIAANAFENLKNNFKAFMDWVTGGMRGAPKAVVQKGLLEGAAPLRAKGMDMPALLGLTEGAPPLRTNPNMGLPGKEELDKAVGEEFDKLGNKLRALGKKGLDQFIPPGMMNAKKGQPGVNDLFGNPVGGKGGEMVGLADFWKKIQSGAFQENMMIRQVRQLEQINHWTEVIAKRRPDPPGPARVGGRR